MKKSQQLRLQFVLREPIVARPDCYIHQHHESHFWDCCVELIGRFGYEPEDLGLWFDSLELRGNGTRWTMALPLWGGNCQRRRVSVLLEGFTERGLVISITSLHFVVLCELITDEPTGTHTILPLHISFWRKYAAKVDRVLRNQAVKIASSKWFDSQKESAT